VNRAVVDTPLVTQATSGLPRRRFLALVRELNVPHRWVGRLCVVRRVDLERALGLGDAPSTPAAPAWTPESLRLRLLAGGKARR
jgi:hypothetical protein